MAKLQITNEAQNKEVIELSRDNYTLGRSESNSIQLSDARTSRHHARIYRENKEYYIEDIGSANGTFVNSHQLAAHYPCRLSNHDIITLGETRILVADIDSGEPSLLPSSEFMPYSDDGLLFNSSEYELSATLDASISMTQLSAEDSSNTANMTKALKRMEAMCIISEAVGNIMHISELMDKAITTIFGIFPKADRSFILLKDGSLYRPVAARSRNCQNISLEKLRVSTTVLRTCTEELMSILSNNTAEDDRFNEAMSIAELAIESFICSPLIVNGEVLGMIQVEGAAGAEEFDETDLQILTGISGQIAIAVKNISLAHEIEKESAQRANLQRYFSPNMVDMLLSGDISTDLGGKLYSGTVFFSDIIGFTAMSEKMPAEQVVTNLNRYFTIMQNLIYQNNGNVDKFGGDAIMAFWSVPKHREDDEFNAVLTGIQMQCELYPFNLELQAENISTIYMGIGVNTGDFVAGNIGSEDKIEFTLIGDNVNLAARIEARAGKTQVMCSEETYSIISSRIAGVRLPPVHFKGKSSPQHTYSVRGIQTAPGRMLTNIPLKLVYDTAKALSEFFMLTTIISDNSEVKVTILADKVFSLNEEIKLKCCLNEYHECIEFTGNIIGITEKETAAGMKYTEYAIDNIQGEAFLAYFTPGFCYTTELTWEQMPREKQVEGN